MGNTILIPTVCVLLLVMFDAFVLKKAGADTSTRGLVTKVVVLGTAFVVASQLFTQGLFLDGRFMGQLNRVGTMAGFMNSALAVVCFMDALSNLMAGWFNLDIEPML